MRTGLIGLILLLTACALPVNDKSVDYDDARRATIEAWEEVIGRVSDECYNRSVDAMVMETGRFPASCMPPIEYGTYIGCYLASKDLGLADDIIYIYEDRTDLQKADTAVHEYIHLLSNCEFGDGQIDLELLARCTVIFLADDELPGDCDTIPGDYFHLDDQLWDDYGPNTVEAVGCANLEV